MEMGTTEIWKQFNGEIYFFILKKVKDADASMDILQNSFLKIHQNLKTVKDPGKVKAWIFQIVRNEIANYYNTKSKTPYPKETLYPVSQENYQDFCCFDQFIDNLPGTYHEVIKLVYLKGKTQSEVAEIVGISLANVKARIRRAKLILIHNFNECCRFSINKEGKLVGESDCPRCHENKSFPKSL